MEFFFYKWKVKGKVLRSLLSNYFPGKVYYVSGEIFYTGSIQ